MSDARERPQATDTSGLGAMESVVRWIERKRLQAPAVLFLEMHRPLMPLAWSAAMLLGGVAAPFFRQSYYEKIEVLRDRAMLDRIVQRLEASRSTDGERGQRP